MGLFNANLIPQDVERLFQKRNESKLIRLLRNKDPLVVKKAEEALCALAVDEEAIKARSQWPEFSFEYSLKKLESRKLSEHQIAVDPYIQALKREKQEIFRIRHQLREAGFSNIDEGRLKEIKKILEPDEEIEYIQGLGAGRGWYSEQGILLTNRRIILFYKGYAFNRFTPISYASITTIERGARKTKITYDKGEFTVLSIEKLISHIAGHVPVDIQSG